MKDLKYYLNKAKRGKWAIGQFNFSTKEQLRAIIKAASKTKSPVILGTSQGEVKFFGIKEAIALTEILKAEYNVAAFLNLDHAKDLTLIKQAVDYGYSAVHFDGSDLSFGKNISNAKKIAVLAHKKGLIVEGEIDDIKGKKLTDANRAEEFVLKTGINSLAIAIGSIHGYHKDVRLDIKRIKEIKSRVNSFLVLHGGSGVPSMQIKRAIAVGINKININTELRMAWRLGVERGLEGKEIKPYNILPEAEKAVQKKVEEKIKLFGSFNKV